MKVLKSGKDNDSFGKEFVCKGHGLGKKVGGCGAVLLVKPGDVETHVDSEGDNSYWFVCPECGAKTYVSWNAFK